MSETHRLILASRSPRRRELLASVGLDFEVQTSDIPEEMGAGETVRDYVLRLAGEKATAIGRELPDAWIVAADTVVHLDETVLEKPHDRKHAIEMLEMLAGRTHTVFSGVALMHFGTGYAQSELVSTAVTISPLDRETIEWYVDTGEPMDKAGSYAIQGIGALFVERVEGSYTNVVGLPLPTLFRMMTSAGISPIQQMTKRSRG